MFLVGIDQFACFVVKHSNRPVPVPQHQYPHIFDQVQRVDMRRHALIGHEADPTRDIEDPGGRVVRPGHYFGFGSVEYHEVDAFGVAFLPFHHFQVGKVHTKYIGQYVEVDLVFISV